VKCTSNKLVSSNIDTVLARGSKPSAGVGRAQREAVVRGRQAPTTEPSPSQEKSSAAASGGTAQRTTKHCQCSSDSNRFTRCACLHLLSAQRIYSAQRYAACSATQCAALHSAQCCTAHSDSQRPAPHSAQRFTAPSASLRTALHSAQHCTPPLPPPALHNAQHFTAPNTILHRAQRAKTRPIATSEPSIYMLRSNGTRPC